MTDLRLHFDGPFTFTEGSNSVFSCCWTHSAGIYLWTNRQQCDNTHLIHYVGETTRLAKRHREHIIQILGLNYAIFDPDDARVGVCTFLWKGLWREKNLAATTRVFAEYERLHQQVLRYLSAMTIFFADVAVETQVRKHIEGCIGWNLRTLHHDCKQLYPDDNHIGTMIDKKHGRLFLTATENIRGLDACIDY